MDHPWTERNHPGFELARSPFGLAVICLAKANGSALLRCAFWLTNPIKLVNASKGSFQ